MPGRQTTLLQTTERGMPASLPGFDTDTAAQQPARLNPGSDDKNASDRSTAEQRSPAPTMHRHIVARGPDAKVCHGISRGSAYLLRGNL